MLSLNKIVAAVLMLAVAPLVSSGIKDDAKGTQPTKVQSMARIAKPSTASGTFTCWQEGRLIFQSKSISNGARGLDKATLVLAAKGKSIQLMDFKNGLCILEQISRQKKPKK